MNALLCFLLWALLAVVAAMRFSREREFSDIERARLVHTSDPRALAEEVRLEKEPLLGSLQFVVKTLLVVAFVVTAMSLYGIGFGVVVAVVGLLLVPIAFRLPFVCALADTLRNLALPFLEKVVDALRPLFVWLRDRDLVTEDISLNSQAELLELIHRSPGIMNKDEQQRLIASLAFDAKSVHEVMTPRSMIEAIPAGETLGPLVMDELYKTGHSRFPVYDGDLDHIVGMIYLHDLLDLKSGNKSAEKTMQKKVHYIREDRDLSHALHGFLSTHHHLFVVVNEYRETVGLLSLEDVVETLIGKKIVDEFDAFDDLRAVAEHNPKENNEPEGKKDI